MNKLILVLVWLTAVIVGLAIYIPKKIENNNKLMGKTCIDRVHRLYAPATEENAQSAYGVLDFKTAYAGELDAKVQCVTQYPLSY